MNPDKSRKDASDGSLLNSDGFEHADEKCIGDTLDIQKFCTTGSGIHSLTTLTNISQKLFNKDAIHTFPDEYSHNINPLYRNH